VIGAAYETLSDPVKRRLYDQELRHGSRQQHYSQQGRRTSTNNDGNPFEGSSTSFRNSNGNNSDQKTYDSYRDFFDATVAGMSEEELAAAVGTVAVVASVVGSMLGSRMMSRSSNRGGRESGGANNVLGSVGSMVGSMIASEVAAASVRALHQESVQRVAYREECRRAVERGEPIPNPPVSTNQFGEFLHKTIDTVKNVTQCAMGNDANQCNSACSSSRNNPNDEDIRSNGLCNLWKMAAEGVKAASRNNQSQRSSYPGQR
jgi:hypothetical protein